MPLKVNGAPATPLALYGVTMNSYTLLVDNPLTVAFTARLFSTYVSPANVVSLILNEVQYPVTVKVALSMVVVYNTYPVINGNVYRFRLVRTPLPVWLILFLGIAVKLYDVHGIKVGTVTVFRFTVLNLSAGQVKVFLPLPR